MKKLCLAAVIAGLFVLTMHAELPVELQKLFDANKNTESRAEQQLWLAKYLLTTGAGQLAIECLVAVQAQKKNVPMQIEAEIMLGKEYLYGKNVASNFDKAEHYLKLASEQKKLSKTQKQEIKKLQETLNNERLVLVTEAPQDDSGAIDSLKRHLRRINRVPQVKDGDMVPQVGDGGEPVLYEVEEQ